MNRLITTLVQLSMLAVCVKLTPMLVKDFNEFRKEKY